MTQETLQSYLADRILSSLEAEVAGSDDGVATLVGAAVRAGPQEQPLAPLANKIADTLVADALKSGLPLTRLRVDSEALGGGNTAELVERVVLHAPFVFKLDSKSKKLAEEALAMRKIKGDPLLPTRYRAAWPTIYAVRQDVPYAYLMEIFPREEGWSSLEDLLYPRDARQALSSREVEPIGSAVLDLMFEGFEASLDVRSVPNLEADYVGRIAERLQKAAGVDERFRSRPLLSRGQLLRPWAEYLAMLEGQRDAIGRLAPKFRTVTHGDPNPGNLMLRLQGSSIEIKFIDPKEWVAGDYLFDIAKLTHFLEATGPVEKPAVPGTVNVSLVERGHDAALTYQYAHAEWTDALVQACYARASAFAAKHGDEHWEARYELAMASNLLGLPVGRLTHKTNPRPESALILYAEGLRWLDRFCQRLDGSSARRSPFVVVGTASDVEPRELAQARALVRQRVPDVKDAVDRRGFRLLHWPPTRPNDRDKPQELSLEHEARLKPGLESGLHRLLDSLHASSGRAAGERVLPNAGPHGDLLVEHVQRASGAQSVDHYYDVDQRIGHRRLIPRMFSLRQRLRTSSFMSWSAESSGDAAGSGSTPAVAPKAPLNLELPFVALGSTGMTARLEFNWLDDPRESLAEATNLQAPESSRLSNPIFLASLAGEVSFEGAAPVIEHTTFREKFLFKQGDGQPRFALNIDRVTAQSLSTGRMASYVDVDISGFRLVDEAELALLTSFYLDFSNEYGLLPNLCTKAWRDAAMLGLLD
jgi:Phosphotransferase enzyme family